MNILALTAAAAEFLRGAELDGNSGRTVRRILEQRLLAHADGTASAILPVDAGLSGLAYAHLVDKTRQRTTSLTKALDELPGPSVVFSVADVYPAKRHLGIQIVAASMPTSMRERQALLAKLHAGLDTLVKYLAAATSVSTTTSVFAELFGADPSEDGSRHRRYAVQVQALVNNDFTELGTTPVVLCELAGILNPAVTAASAQLDAKYAAEDAALTQPQQNQN